MIIQLVSLLMKMMCTLMTDDRKSPLVSISKQFCRIYAKKGTTWLATSLFSLASDRKMYFECLILEFLPNINVLVR